MGLTVELLTVVARMICGPMKERYAKIKFKYKLRIHHGYVGFALLLMHILYPLDTIFILGIALLLSDALHHFVVLPLWVGTTEFP